MQAAVLIWRPIQTHSEEVHSVRAQSEAMAEHSPRLVAKYLAEQYNRKS